MINFKNRILKWYYKSDRFITVPNKNFFDHNGFLGLIKDYDNIRLQCNVDIPKVGNVYDWKVDKNHLVENTITTWAKLNQYEHHEYVVLEKWLGSDQYKLQLRLQIKEAIDQPKTNVTNLK